MHTATVASSWFDAHSIQRLKHLPDLSTADFFLFRKVKEGGGGGQSLDQDSIKNACKGVTRTLTAFDFTTTSESGWSTAKSVSASAVSLSKNLKK
jgi:hypothetical protein